MRVWILIFLFITMLPMAANAVAFPESWQLSNDDKRRVKSAFDMLKRDRYTSAEAQVKRVESGVIRDYFTWRKLVANSRFANLDEMMAFYKNRPHWPKRQLLQKNIERDLRELGDTQAIIEFYDQGNGQFTYPILPEAKQLLADALIVNGNYEQTHYDLINSLIQDAWLSLSMNEREAKEFRARYSRFIGEDSIVRRASEMVWQERYSEAKQLFPLLSEDEEYLMRARILLRTARYGVDNAIQKLAPIHMQDEGLLYDRIKWRRKHNINGNMESLLKITPSIKYHPKEFWNITKGYIIDFRDAGNYELAYTLAANHGFDGQKDAGGYAHGEWLAGWIAMQYMNKPHTAYTHFYNIYQIASTPITRGRASYWAAKAAAKNGNKDIAKSWINMAKQYPTSFYGQLALAESGQAVSIPKIDPVMFNFSDYHSNELMQIAYIAYQFNQQTQGFSFAEQAFKNASTMREKQHVLELMKSAGQHQHTILLANRASYDDGPILLDYGYPTLDVFGQQTMHAFSLPESPLVHAITRQESRFLPTAQSHVGALGLMQLMPATAQETANKVGKRYKKYELTRNTAYNVELGSAYLQSRIDYYDGSYILAIAAYNGGAGNVNKWIRKYGDPRRLKDSEAILRWIETIPFSETRNYVMRVLEQLQMYRLRLNQNKNSTVLNDIRR